MQGERRESVSFIWRAVGAERRQERSRAEQGRGWKQDEARATGEEARLAASRESGVRLPTSKLQGEEERRSV